MSDRIPYLRAARPGDSPATQPKPILRPLALLEVARAECFLNELDGRTTGADLPRAIYLLGLAEGHLNTVVELIRTVTALPR